MNKLLRQMLPFGSLIFIILILSILRTDTFLTTENFLNVFRRSSVYGIIAIGMTSIIISGGIDLSVGSMLAMCGMLGAGTMVLLNGESPQNWAQTVGTITGIGVGVICGFVNGLLITKLKLQPFIVTLGTMSFFRGVALVIKDGQPINVPTSYAYLGEGAILQIPVSIIIFAIIIAAAIFILRYTRLGRYTYAIGSNREAAFHAGVNVDRNLIYIYTFTGLLVGIAAMIATSRVVSAQPTAGMGYELDVIAAVVIGGASLSGGRGTITGTIIGTLLISFLRNGCTLLGISTNAQLIVIGMIIVIAVAVDQIAQAKSAKTS